MKAQRIRVDYLTAPLGLGNPTPAILLELQWRQETNCI